MKKLVFLFIPLMFFFGCEEEENDDEPIIGYSCLLIGSWNQTIFREYYIPLDNVNIEDDWNSFNTSEIIGAQCQCSYWHPDCKGDQYYGTQSNECWIWIFAEDGGYYMVREDNGFYVNLGNWGGDCLNYDNIFAYNGDDYGCGGGFNCWIKIINVSSNELVIRHYAEDNSDTDFYMTEYFFTRVN